MKTAYLTILLTFFVAFAMTPVQIIEPGPLGEKNIREIAENTPLELIADSISVFYKRNGYPIADVKVGIDSLSESDITAKIRVNSGPISSVEEYHIMGFPLDLPRLEIAVDKPFTEWKLARDMEKLVQKLEDGGFPFASVNIESLAIGPVQTDEVPVRVELKVDAGESVQINQVVIPEKSKTKPYVVERLMLLDLPEEYSQTRINKGVDRIEDTGWLSTSGEPRLLLDETGFWLLKVPVVEGRSVTMNGVLGYTPSGDGKGVTGHFDAEFNNIRGTARSLSFAWDQVASEKMEIEASYTEPWLLNGPGDVILSGRYYAVDSTYTERESGLDYSLPISFKLSITNGISIRAVDPDSIGQNVLNIPTSREYSLKTAAKWKGLRPRLNPREGYHAKLELKGSYIERSGPADLFETLDQYEPIFRTEIDFETAREILKRQVIDVSVSGRSALSNGPLPLSDRYYLGGLGSLRGYREEQFSAEHIGWANVEWRALLSSEAHAYLFFDTGLIRPSGENEEIKFGYGIGLRLNTAIGMWDVSYGLGEGDALTGGYIHVGLKTGFE